jgi:hypothetical protein
MRGSCVQFCVGRDFFGRLGDRSPVDRHETGCYCSLRLGAAFKQAALDQKKIDALA